jgi:hypothetical protein
MSDGCPTGQRGGYEGARELAAIPAIRAIQPLVELPHWAGLIERGTSGADMREQVVGKVAPMLSRCSFFQREVAATPRESTG